MDEAVGHWWYLEEIKMNMSPTLYGTEPIPKEGGMEEGIHLE